MGSTALSTLYDKINEEIERLEAHIKSGQKPTVSKDMSRYLKVIELVDDSLPNNEETSTGESEKDGKDLGSQATDTCAVVASEKDIVQAASQDNTSLEADKCANIEEQENVSTAEMQGSTSQETGNHTDGATEKKTFSATPQDKTPLKADEPADVKADEQADTKTDERADAKADELPDAKADTKTDEQTDTKANVTADKPINAKADERAYTKKDEQADTKADGQAEVKADGPTDAKADERADTKKDKQADPKPDEPADTKTVTSSITQDAPEQNSPEKTYAWVANGKNGKEDLWAKGFSALASSLKMSAREMNGIYHIRDASETQYMICKSMLGFDVFRAHNDEGAETRETICFIAAIIRNRFTNSCKTRKLKTCRVIEELDNKLYLVLNGSGGYDEVNKLSDNQKDVLRDIGIKTEDISLVAGEICYRLRKNNGAGLSQFHDSPDTIRERIENLNAGSNQSDNANLTPDNAESQTENPENNVENGSTMASPTESRKVGRPKGRKNNKTLEREAAAKEDDNVVKEQKRRGRPPGRKNDKTLEKESEERKAGINSKEKRPKGRPFGSKDSKPRHRRTKAEIEAAKEDATSQ